MQRFTHSLIAFALSAGLANAMPLPAGTTSPDVEFSEASDFASNRFTTLTDRSLSDFSGSVVLFMLHDPF